MHVHAKLIAFAITGAEHLTYDGGGGERFWKNSSTLKQDKKFLLDKLYITLDKLYITLDKL